MPVKISVVMATYNSGERLDAAVASVLGQSLPPYEYELVLVDDGSTDGTFDRAERLAAEHQQMKVHRIENSGWPGRPRNVGTHAATGAYVLYMDHDDYLFPEALERMYQFADANGSDVLLAKEVVLGGGTPGWNTWRSDVGRVDRIDAAVLECMTPHKLFRRQFLLDQNVWFPEGRIRLEDYDFNAQAYTRAQVVSILASYPCYQWVIHTTNAHKDAFPLEKYWRSFEHSLLPIQSLPDGELRDEMLLRWYSSRVLLRAGIDFGKHSPAYRTTFLKTVPDVMRHFVPSLDQQLSAADRPRSSLLRRGDGEALLRLSTLDRACAATLSPAAFEWRGSALHVEVEGHLRDGAGPMRVRREGGRVRRVLPAGLAEAVAPTDLDITDDLAAGVIELSVRGRRSGVEWPVESSGRLWLDGEDDDLMLRLAVEGSVDPEKAALGGSLADETWDVWVRVSALGFKPRTKVAVVAAKPLPALVDGRHLVAYRTKGGHLAIDVGAVLRSVVGSSRPHAQDAHIGGPRRGRRLTLGLPGVHVHGVSRLWGTLIVGKDKLPALLVADSDGARVEADLGSLERGLHPLAFQLVAGHTGRPPLALAVRRFGVRVVDRSKRSSAKG